MDYDKRKIYYPFPFDHSIYPAVDFNNYFIHFSPFSRYCRDVYGLKNKQEIRYVYEKLHQIIGNKIEPKDNINESKEPNNIFLDKVVKYLIDGTSINTKYNYISFPDYLKPNKIYYNNYGHRLISPNAHWQPYAAFYIDCKSFFGITKSKEVEYVYEKYKEYILSLLYSQVPNF
jgi:hypothetical protein